MTWVELASIGGGITVVATCVATVYKVAFFAGKWEEKEKVVDAIKKELSNIKNAIFRLGASVQALEADVQILKTDVQMLKTGVQILSQEKGSIIEESNSPIRLTNVGKDIAKKINAEKIIEDKLEILSAEHFADLDIKLDIEAKAREISPDIFEKLDEETKRIAKDVLYEQGFPLPVIYPVLALILRDKIIQRKEKKEHAKTSA